MSLLLRFFRRAVTVAFVVNFAHVGVSEGQSRTRTTRAAPATAEDILNLTKKLDSLQSKLAEIQQLLRNQAATLPVGATRSPTQQPAKADQNMVLPFVPDQGMGSADAPFVLVEFGDLQCPFCNDFAKHTLPGFVETYVKTGKIRLLSAEFPLESHPYASKLSRASICAGEQDKYWPIHDALLNAKAASVDDAIEQATASSNLSKDSFQRCMSSPDLQKRLDMQAAQAREAGVYSTPTFLLGKIENGSVKGITFVGDLPPEEFTKEVEKSMKHLSEGEHDSKSPSVQAK